MRKGGARRVAVGLRVATAVALLGAASWACRTPDATPLPAEPLQPFLERAEEARGRAFERPVRASLVPPSKVGARLEREMRRLLDPEVFAAQVALLEALGLLPRGADLWGELLELQGEAVAGYYAPLDDGLYVVARDPAALTRSLADPLTGRILVHELGHALQAQHARIMEIGLGLQEPDDLAFALSSLLEGDALFTEMRDAELRHGVPRPGAAAYARVFEADVRHGLPDVSPWLAAMFLSPYPAGYAWVATRYTQAGLAGLDAAWLDPPLSSAAVLAPSRIRRGRREVRAPDLAPLGCEVVASNAYGMIGLGLWLGLSDEARLELPWRADRAWALACETGPGWAWLVELETAQDLEAWLPRLHARAVRAHPAARAVRGATSVVVSGGLPPRVATALQRGARFEDHADLEAWAAAHPEVLERSRRLRAAFEARGSAPPRSDPDRVGYARGR